MLIVVLSVLSWIYGNDLTPLQSFVFWNGIYFFIFFVEIFVFDGVASSALIVSNLRTKVAQHWNLGFGTVVLDVPQSRAVEGFVMKS